MRRDPHKSERRVAPEHPASLALAGALAVLLTVCAPRGELLAYVDATATQHAAIADVVRDYYRARNALAGGTSAERLWQEYPSLAQNRNVAAGVNVEPEFVERTRRLGVRVVMTNEAAYEPLRVLVHNSDAIAFVHGEEQWSLPAGDRTVFEITTLIYVAQRDGVWAIVRTDERVLGEPYPSLPSPR